MLKEKTIESTTSIQMSEATTDAESTLNYNFKKLIFKGSIWFHDSLYRKSEWFCK